MSNSDLETLTTLFQQMRALQERAEAILQNGNLGHGDVSAAPQQAISSEEVIDQRLLALLHPETASEQVGNMLRVFRESVGMTQADLANVTGQNKTFIGRVERGGTNATIGTVLQISEGLDADAAFGLYPKDGS